MNQKGRPIRTASLETILGNYILVVACVSGVNHLYKMGTISSVSRVDEIIPPIIVQPMGDHKPLFVKVKGSSPQMVVIVVSMMGVKRVSAALIRASFTFMPLSLSWLV